MEINLMLIGTIIGSAAFGAVVGKLMDAFLLSKINNNIEKNKFLREAKLEEFSKLSQELLSLGFENLSYYDEWKFNAIVAKSILLIDDVMLINEIREFEKKLINFTRNEYPKIYKEQDENNIVLPDGEKVKPKDVKIGYLINKLEKEAFLIVSKLNKNLKNT